MNLKVITATTLLALASPVLRQQARPATAAQTKSTTDLPADTVKAMDKLHADTFAAWVKAQKLLDKELEKPESKAANLDFLFMLKKGGPIMVVSTAALAKHPEHGKLLLEVLKHPDGVTNTKEVLVRNLGESPLADEFKTVSTPEQLLSVIERISPAVEAEFNKKMAELPNGKAIAPLLKNSMTLHNTKTLFVNYMSVHGYEPDPLFHNFSKKKAQR